MADEQEAEGCLGRNWERLEAEAEEPAAGASVPEAEARLVAMAHVELADGLWHRAGAGPVTLAHRLAASTIYSLIYEDSRDWRLSAVVRDIVALGEAVLPESLNALEASIRLVVDGTPYRPVVERLAGDRGAAERRFHDVISLASSIARKVATVP